jgi:lipopolysaccharide transport system permease protein
MVIHPRSPASLACSLWRNRGLLRDLARRDAVGRYKGSFLGIFWSLLAPLLMLAIYTFVFGNVFRARWSGAGESTGEFAISLFAGLIVFNFFAECLNRAPGVILANTNFVKKVVFPLEILPCVTIGSALFHTCVSVGILLAFEIHLTGGVPATALLFPIVVLPLLLFTAGLSWLLAALGVYLRDVGQTVALLVSGLMFLSPVFFPRSAVPERFRLLMNLNPLAVPIEQARSVLVQGGGIDGPEWLLELAVSSLLCWIGFAVFQKLRRGFADVL